MERFNFYHVSDLHFVDQPLQFGPKRLTPRQLRSRLVDALVRLQYSKPLAVVPNLPVAALDYLAAERLAHFIGDNLDYTDFILVSGDVADTGSLANVRVAKAFFHGALKLPYQRHRKLRDIASLCPILLVPGNHDRFSGWMRRPGARHFDSVFGRSWALSSPTTSAIRGIRVTRLRKPTADLLVCCADFTLRRGDALTPERWLGHGRVNDLRLGQLVRITTAEKSASAKTAVLWVVHFPPSSPYGSDRLRLEDEHKLIDAAKDCSVNMMLCGHLHNQHHYWVGATGRTRVVVAGTATANTHGVGNAFHSVSLEIDTGNICRAHLTSYYRHPHEGDFNPDSPVVVDLLPEI